MRPFPLVLFVILNLLGPATTVRAASRCAAESSGCSVQAGEWMPDVAIRRAELLARVERFAAESRSREVDEIRQGQTWRYLASRPASGRVR